MSACSICEYVVRASQIVDGAECDSVYIDGLARGFTLSDKTTYEEFCQEHADMLNSALTKAGAKPVSLNRGGSA